MNLKDYFLFTEFLIKHSFREVIWLYYIFLGGKNAHVLGQGM